MSKIKKENSQMRLFVQELLDQISDSVDRVNWQNKNIYANWLAQSFYYVSHSTRLLALSAARFNQNENKYHLRCIDHMREEKSHEILAARDLVNMEENIIDYKELASTSALYQTQYYLIEYEHPAALFGYILFLEGLSIQKGPTIYKTTKEAFGEKSCSFLKVHVEEDPDHLEKAFEQMDTLSVDLWPLVLRSAELAYEFYDHLLTQVSQGRISRHESKVLEPFRPKEATPLTQKIW